jgi:hypothetical protein
MFNTFPNIFVESRLRMIFTDTAYVKTFLSIISGHLKYYHLPPPWRVTIGVDVLTGKSRIDFFAHIGRMDKKVQSRFVYSHSVSQPTVLIVVIWAKIIKNGKAYRRPKADPVPASERDKIVASSP